LILTPFKQKLTAEDGEDFAEAAEKTTSFAFLRVNLSVLCGKISKRIECEL